MILSPEQSSPPQPGLGLVQLRCLVITPRPSPQFAEQFVILYQSLHPPCTKGISVSIHGLLLLARILSNFQLIKYHRSGRFCR